MVLRSQLQSRNAPQEKFTLRYDRHAMSVPIQLHAAVAGLSLTGSTGIMISYFVIKDLRKHPTSLVFYLSICDFFFTLKYFLVLFVPSFAALMSEQPSTSVGCIVSALW